MTLERAPLRIGILGLGQIAQAAHLPGFDKLRDARVTAVATSRESHGRRLASRFGIPNLFADWKRLVRSPSVDAVSICLPNHLHAPAALAALRAGKHVLVEKPIALSSVQAVSMIREAKRRRLTLMVHHNMRFDPAIRCAGSILSKVRLGKVFAFKCTLSHRGPEAWSPRATWFRKSRLSGGGVVIDLGVHVFDTLSYLLGDRIHSVVGTSPPFSGRTESHATVLLRFRGGAVGSVTLSWRDAHYQNRYYLFGDQGTMYVNLGKGEPVAVQSLNTSGLVFPPLGPECFEPTLYDHFVQCVRSGRTPETGGATGLEALASAEAFYRSVKSRSWERVRIPKA